MLISVILTALQVSTVSMDSLYAADLGLLFLLSIHNFSPPILVSNMHHGTTNTDWICPQMLPFNMLVCLNFTEQPVTFSLALSAPGATNCLLCISCSSSVTKRPSSQQSKTEFSLCWDLTLRICIYSFLGERSDL